MMKCTLILALVGSVSPQFLPHTAAWFADSDAGFPSFGPANDGTTNQKTCAGTSSNYTLTMKNQNKNKGSGAAGRCSALTKENGVNGVKVFYDINCVCKKPSETERTVPKDTDEWDAQYYDGIQPGLKMGCSNNWNHVEIRIWTGSEGTGTAAECTTDWNLNRDLTDGHQHWLVYLSMAQWQQYYDGLCVPDLQVRAWKGYGIEQSSGAKNSNQIAGWSPYKAMAMMQFEPWNENIMTCGAKGPTVAPTTSPTPPPTPATEAPTNAIEAPTIEFNAATSSSKVPPLFALLTATLLYALGL